MLHFWDGHKTQLLSALGVLASLAYAMGWIDEKMALAIGGLVGSGGLSTLRRGIKTEVAAVVAQGDAVQIQMARVNTTVATVAPAIVRVAAQVQDVKAVVEDATHPLPHRTDVAPHVIRP